MKPCNLAVEYCEYRSAILGPISLLKFQRDLIYEKFIVSRFRLHYKETIIII